MTFHSYFIKNPNRHFDFYRASIIMIMLTQFISAEGVALLLFTPRPVHTG